LRIQIRVCSLQFLLAFGNVPHLGVVSVPLRVELQSGDSPAVSIGRVNRVSSGGGLLDGVILEDLLALGLIVLGHVVGGGGVHEGGGVDLGGHGLL